jgi:hypothetical protein
MIKNDVVKLTNESEFEQLNLRVKNWFFKHLIDPEKIVVADECEPDVTHELWLITDDIGEEDGSYRIVYSDEKKVFGLEMRTKNEVSSFLGFYGTLVATLSGL